MEFWNAVDFWLAKTAVDVGLAIVAVAVCLAGLWAVRRGR